jgi:hypothetical protein
MNTRAADKSGTLTDDQLFGNGLEVPAVCSGYLPLAVQAQLTLRDVRITVCLTSRTPCPALDEHTGDCLAGYCVYRGQP